MVLQKSPGGITSEPKGSTYLEATVSIGGIHLPQNLPLFCDWSSQAHNNYYVVALTALSQNSRGAQRHNYVSDP